MDKVELTVEGERVDWRPRSPFNRASLPGSLRMDRCPTGGCELTDRSVYVIQRGGHDGPLKIGSSCNPRQRLRQLQTGCPERLLLLVSACGGHFVETSLHNRLHSHRLVGEWFRCNDETIQTIAEEVVFPSLFHQLRGAMGDGIGTIASWDDREAFKEQLAVLRRLGIKVGGVR